MKRRVAMMLACSLLVVACGFREGSDTLQGTPFGDAPTAGRHGDLRLLVDGQSRSYDLYVPEGTQAGDLAVVLLFHGQRGSAGQLMGERRIGAAPFAEWIDIANSNNIVLVVPNGVEGPDGHMGWNDCRGDATSNPDVDDVAFVEALVDEVASALPIDASRVFASGISNGGHLALRLAIERPALVAAVAPIAAAMPADSACPVPTAPVPVLFVNGTADPILPFEGGAMPESRGTVQSSFASLEVWADLSAPSAEADSESSAEFVSEALPETSSNDGSTVVAHRFTGDASAWLYEVVGGGHTEPSESERYTRLFKRVVGAQNGDIESAQLIWDFFALVE